METEPLSHSRISKNSGACEGGIIEGEEKKESEKKRKRRGMVMASRKTRDERMGKRKGMGERVHRRGDQSGDG
jgi:hypothetical protein